MTLAAFGSNFTHVNDAAKNCYIRKVAPRRPGELDILKEPYTLAFKSFTFKNQAKRQNASANVDMNATLRQIRDSILASTVTDANND